MLAALLLLVLVGAPVLVLLLRAWAEAAGEDRLLRQLVQLASRDPSGARRLLGEHPELLTARTVHDQTPLHTCAVEGLADGVRLLADAGVPVDARNDLGNTALTDTVARGDLAMTRLLLWHGADPNAVRWGQGPALHVAVAQGNPAIAAALLDAGARGDYVTDSGERVWDAVARAETARDELARVLADHGVALPSVP